MDVDAIIDAIATDGYAVLDHVLPIADVRALQVELARLHQTNALTPAKVGRLNGFEMPKNLASQQKIRGDATFWLDESQTTNAAVGTYFHTMQLLKHAFNQQLMLGLDALEAHFAYYPAGAFYQKHLDQFQDVQTLQTVHQQRKISSVFYLNANWQEEFGGELRLYLNDKANGFLEFLPIENRLVLFLSDRFWHEVKPATQPRCSITGWFKTRDTRLAYN